MGLRHSDVDRGYIKLYRKILDSGIIGNHKLTTFWVWCLLKASHKPRKQIVGFQEVHLDRGQFVFGRRKAASALNLTEREVRTCLNTLKSTNRLTVKTTNKFSVITIVNWDTYQQCEQENDHQDDQQATSKRPASDHKQECKE